MTKVLRRITLTKRVANSNNRPIAGLAGTIDPVLTNTREPTTINPPSSRTAARNSSIRDRSMGSSGREPKNQEKLLPANSHEQPSEEKVGYGKPPLQFRFKKGQSGNPKGRSKGNKNLRTLFEAEWEAPVEVLEGGEKKKISKGALITKNLFRQAAKGDLKAAAVTFKMEERFSKPSPESLNSTTASSSESIRQELTPMQLLIIECFGPKRVSVVKPAEPATAGSSVSTTKSQPTTKGGNKS